MMNLQLALTLIIGFCTIWILSISEASGDGSEPRISRSFKTWKNPNSEPNSAQNSDRSIITMNKEEMDDFVAIADVREEICNQEFLNRINNMLLKYSNNPSNLIPYLQYNKQRLLSECANRYNINNLDEEVQTTLGQTSYQPEEPEEMPNEQASQIFNEIRGPLEKLDGIRKEVREKIRLIDEVWITKYRAVFYGETNPKDPEEMLEVLENLHLDYRFTSMSDDLKPLDDEIFDLFKLTYKQPSKCDDKSFTRYENYAKKYSNGFSSSILDYVMYQRSKFWQTCKQTVLNNQRGQRSQEVVDNVEIEALSLADHIMTRSSHSQEPYLVDSVKSIQDGVTDYAKDKLGKKAYKKEKMDKLFDATVQVCYSVKDRSRGGENIAEIIKSRPDLKNDLDEKSIKWLTAIAACRIIIDHSPVIKDATLSFFQEQHREDKNKSCLGGLFS